MNLVKIINIKSILNLHILFKERETKVETLDEAEGEQKPDQCWLS